MTTSEPQLYHLCSCCEGGNTGTWRVSRHGSCSCYRSGVVLVACSGEPPGPAHDGEGETLPWLDRAWRKWELHEAKAAGVAMQRPLGLALDTGSFSAVT